MLDEVHNCLSRRHCKATAKKSSTQPLPQQLSNQCEMNSASASFTATAKGIHKQFQDRKDGLAQPLLRQLPSRYKENFFSALVPETIKQELNKMCLKLCHYNCQTNAKNNYSQSLSQELHNKCKKYFIYVFIEATAKPMQRKACLYLTHSNIKYLSLKFKSKESTKESLFLPQPQQLQINLVKHRDYPYLSCTNSNTGAKERLYPPQFQPL